jgi:biotin carboxyl carrier protein
MRENGAMSLRGLSRNELASLLGAFEDLGLSELILSVAGTRVELTSNGRPPLDRTMIASGQEHQTSGDRRRGSLRQVLSPSVGIVRLAPATEAPPFAPAGAQVHAEDVVCILDVWTSTLPVQAGLDGAVREVQVTEGTMVEYGQPLFALEGSDAHWVAGTSSERPAAARSSSSSA